MQDKDSVLFSVAGGGTPPIQLQNTSFRGRRISASKVPTSEVAVTAYESQGGNSTVFPCFGVDPLDNAALQALREQRFNNVTDLQNEFEDIGNANCHSFENAILTYASIYYAVTDLVGVSGTITQGKLTSNCIWQDLIVLI